MSRGRNRKKNKLRAPLSGPPRPDDPALPARSAPLPSPPPGAPKAAGAGPAPSVDERREASKRAFLLQKLRHALARRREFEAEAYLNQLWPSRSEGSARLRWLLAFWPQRAALELGRMPLDRLSQPEVVAAIAETVLLLPEEVFSGLAKAGAPFVAEAALVRQANALLAEGRDEEALEALRAIGLRSPFREARLFLKGLWAYYQGASEKVAQAAATLRESRVYGALARALTRAAGNTDGSDAGGGEASPGPTAQAILAAPALPAQRDQVRLARIQQLLREGKPNAALREVSAGAAKDASPLEEALRRDLPGVLLALELDPVDIAERLSRALPQDPEDPHRSRLLALLCETSGELLQATHYWEQYEEEIARGAIPMSAEERRMSQALLLHRLGGIWCKLAEHGGDDLDLFAFGAESNAEPCQLARGYLEAAIDLDPEPMEPWMDLLQLNEQMGQDRESDRVLERLVQQFPDHPQSLLAAANSAGKRKAFDKALRYARRAAALEPLNREARDVESWLLLRKGRKSLHAGHLGRARSCYEDAARIPHRSEGARMKALAETAAFLDEVGSGEEALACRDEQLRADPRPWLWSGYFLVGRQHLLRPALRRAAPRTSPQVAKVDPFAVLSGRPTPNELSDLLALWRAARKEQEEIPAEMPRLLERAVALSGAALRQKEDLHDALRCALPAEQALPVAEAAQRLFPEEPAFACARYEAALALRVPVGYFDRAEAELGEISRRLGGAPSAENDSEEGEPLANPFQSAAGSFLYGMRVASLQRQIRKYRRNSGMKPPRLKRSDPGQSEFSWE